MTTVWLVDATAVHGLHERELMRTLSADERRRAERFRLPAARRSFIAVRSALRLILAPIVGRAAPELEFEYGHYGKPRLRSHPQSHVAFNVSHAADIGLVAVSSGPSIGVDVARIEPDYPVEQVASRFFTAAESKAILALPDVDRTRAFFACWTRKEAVIKADGRGLSAPLDCFAAPLGRYASPSEPTVLHTSDGRAHLWHVCRLNLGRNFMAAVATDTPNDVVVRRWLAPSLDTYGLSNGAAMHSARNGAQHSG